MTDDLLYDVVSALADADGTDPQDLDYELAEYVNPDAMRRLSEMGDGPWEFTFRVPDHEVTLRHTGAILVDGMVVRPGDDPIIGDPDAERDHEPIQPHARTVLDSLSGMAYRCRNRRGWPMDFVSDGCRELTGYDPTALVLGSVSYGTDVVHPDDREEVWEEVQRALRNRKPFHLTYRIRTADGERKRVREFGRGTYEDGDPVGCVGLITAGIPGETLLGMLGAQEQPP